MNHGPPKNAVQHLGLQCIKYSCRAKCFSSSVTLQIHVWFFHVFLLLYRGLHNYFLLSCKVVWIQSHHRQWKFKLWAGKLAWGVKAKHCWAFSTNFLFNKVWWQCPAMFRQKKMKTKNSNFHNSLEVMGSNPG